MHVLKAGGLLGGRLFVPFCLFVCYVMRRHIDTRSCMYILKAAEDGGLLVSRMFVPLGSFSPQTYQHPTYPDVLLGKHPVVCFLRILFFIIV